MGILTQTLDPRRGRNARLLHNNERSWSSWARKVLMNFDYKMLNLENFDSTAIYVKKFYQVRQRTGEKS
mgnify:CR=1 FL=1